MAFRKKAEKCKEKAYSKAAEPKELFVIKNATHVDLYDVPEYMSQSLEKLHCYFEKYLSQ